MNLEKGIYPVFKPKGPTSFDMVHKIRKLSGEKRVGHAGTLDPLASGVLVIAIGREFTKQLNEAQSKEKEYDAVIDLSKTSTTDDQEGDKEEIHIIKVPSELDIRSVLNSFVGEIMQKPPIFSALKVSGKPMYKYARQGKELEIKERMVLVKNIELISFEWPFLRLKITTGPGVYIRSIARDLGVKLKTGGYLFDLIRTRVGNYKIEDCIILD